MTAESKWIMVDVEADGPCPGLYSMVSFGAVYVDPEGKLDRTFYSKVLQPLPGAEWDPEALAVSGHTRAEMRDDGLDPCDVMNDFAEWIAGLKLGGRPMFISDNNGFDWQFVNYYFHLAGGNPFGHSSTNLGSLYKGLVGKMRKNFKHLRKTKHTHHPVDDAKGNAEAMLTINERHGGIFF